jgi:hypothetical protein
MSALGHERTFGDLLDDFVRERPDEATPHASPHIPPRLSHYGSNPHRRSERGATDNGLRARQTEGIFSIPLLKMHFPWRY